MSNSCYDGSMWDDNTDFYMSPVAPFREKINIEAFGGWLDEFEEFVWDYRAKLIADLVQRSMDIIIDDIAFGDGVCDSVFCKEDLNIKIYLDDGTLVHSERQPFYAWQRGRTVGKQK